MNQMNDEMKKRNRIESNESTHESNVKLRLECLLLPEWQ